MNIQEKCNELIRIATDISAINLNKREINHEIKASKHVITDDKLLIELYGIKHLFFYLKVMGDETEKWLSVLEKEDNHFNVVGELYFPLTIMSMNGNRLVIEKEKIKWEKKYELKESESEENEDNEDNESEDSEYTDDEQSDYGSEELLIKRDGIHVSLA